MKPELLSMSAFGPFSHTQDIDFNALSEHALFLINGPTGAGKTTILDGICFALYGKTTGNEREGTQMRCDMADDDLLTEVTFQFRLGEDCYRIRRVPEQARKKKSGDGFTQQKPEAQLYRIETDGTQTLLVETKVSEATTEIEQLIGLDVEQFRQVMVLPQGKFRELLMADSKSREKIFGQLFQTQIYKRIEDQLKQQSASIRQQVQDIRNQRKGILQSAELDSDKALAEQTEGLKPQLEQAEKQKHSAQMELQTATKSLESAQQLKQKFVEFNNAKEKQQQLKQQAETIDQIKHKLELAHQASKLLPVFENFKQRQQEHSNSELQLKSAQHQLQKIEGELQAFQQQLQQQPQLESDLKQAHIKLERLQQLQPLVIEKQNLVEQVHRNNQQLNIGKQKEGEAKQALQQLAAHKIQLQQQVGELQKQSSAQFELQNQVNTLESILSRYEQYQQQKAQVNRLQQQLEQAKQQGLALKASHQQAESEYKMLQLTWHQSQAAVLASQLNNGDACPVCGSVEHPQLATASVTPPTERQLDTAAKAEQQALQKLNDARSQYSSLQDQLKLLNTQIQPLKEQLADYLIQPISEWQNQHKALYAQLQQAIQAQSSLNQTQQQLQGIEQQEQQCRQELESLTTEANRQDKVVTELQAKLASVDQQLPDNINDAEQLSSSLSDAEKLAQDLDNQLKNLLQQSTQLNERLASAKSVLTSAEERIKETQVNSDEAQKVFEQQSSDAGFADGAAVEKSIIDQDKQVQLKEQVEQYQQQLAVNEAQVSGFNKDLEGQEPPETALLEQVVKQKQQLLKDKEQAWQALESTRSQLHNIQTRLVEVDETSKSLEQEYAVVGTLSDIANGQTGNKISLNRFVLSVLLDDVLLDASTRLSVMSKGRYRLYRKEDKAKGNKASGLDLEVEDAYTSKVRDVATLSGGESFMAALSLALALSEVVQAYAGGIKLDTLFIDEGFGSLDQDSLDLAVRTLMDLQSTGRMIGVISHVTEMKEQIQQRIDISKNSTGSVAKVVAI
ncbi:SMC family ATPase [Parashewanella curva]|uniref:SMC family ATPase n=1 Tax=Parashewanella curva TaxID=2338552 RepID=A0A3L8PYC0_9GAMM|nr:SMC family ATPase [Parashewanella curva]RLV60416.1 SMC family ATPase [Parashewanella curva]